MPNLTIDPNLYLLYHKRFLRQLFSLCTLILTLSYTSCVAQHKKAERYVQKAKSSTTYAEKKDYLAKAIQKDSSWAEAYQQWAGVEIQRQQVKKAIRILRMLTQKATAYDPRVHHTLGQLLMEQEKFAEAIKEWDAFLHTTALYPDLRIEAEQERARAKRNMHARAHPTASNLRPLPPQINTAASEYLPLLSITEHQMIFTRRHRQDEDFYISATTEAGWSEAKPIEALNSPQSEGAGCLSVDGTILIFTRCNDRLGYGSCDLYISQIGQDGQWSTPQNLGPKINTSYKETQPALSPDGSTLYFASNRPGGQGKMDLWSVQWKAKEGWSSAVPLDSGINTPYHEQTPFVHSDHIHLYFTSDRPGGLGQSDLYRCTKSANNWLPHPINLGHPINTPKEEGTIYIRTSGTSGFMGRKTAMNTYDIFAFDLSEEIAAIPTTYIEGKVSHIQDHSPIMASLTLIDEANGNTIAHLTTKIDGSFILPISKDRTYQLFAEAPGYAFHSSRWEGNILWADSLGIELNIQLTPLKAVATDSVSDPIVLENILFATASAKLAPASMPTIQRLVELVEENEDIHLAIHGHTDHIGSAQANQILSLQRAKAVHDALIENGISPDRVSYKGFGESQPKVEGDSEDIRAQNRRTECLILYKNNQKN